MNRLKLKRMIVGLTQLELARRADLSEQQITKIETGRVVPPQRIRQALAQALRTSEDEIFGPGWTAPVKTLPKGVVHDRA